MAQWVLLRYGVLAAVVGLTVAVLAHILIDRYTPTPLTIAPVAEGPIVVVVDGAVASPGVVELPAGARLHDVLEAVGGLLPNADATRLNLASRVRDGERIIIPALISTPALSSVPPGATPGAQAASPAALLDLNTATLADFETLPGIGPVIAQRILDFREFYGPFVSVDQLAEVEGISPAMVDRIRPWVTVDG